MKTIVIIILSLLSHSAFACFSPPEGLVEQHELQSMIYLSLAIGFLVLSLVLRFISNRHRIWVPLLFITTFTYIPAYIWHFGQIYSGECGIPETLLAIKVLSGGMIVLLTYEVVYFLKERRKHAT
ncbi:MAG: hypothetical protein D6B28_08320 [Gammaproteobacteria bacterium]|nr:MAG: hypothetical protein D6B28_08320 [Gammaproteobacteria bacterium]